MSTPLSPDRVTTTGTRELPAYLSNGVIGLRVVDIPLLPGMTMVSSFTGLHPVMQVEAAANAPYPLAGDLAIDDVWLVTAPHLAEFVDQAYDFAAGELTTRFRFHGEKATANVEVLTFCSQKRPTLALQEVAVEVSAPCELQMRALVDINDVHGRVARRDLEPPGRDGDLIDGSLSWLSLGDLSRCGVAYVTEFRGDAAAEKRQADWGLESSLATDYRLRAEPGRRYRLRQIACLVPSRLHEDPDRAATRVVAMAGADGFDELRRENHVEWAELWKGRIVIDADDDRWQRLADAAFFYLNSSVHSSSPSSTSIYGLAQWKDYHYYYGHVMWDVDVFAVPPLLLSQPEAARSMLGYRLESLAAARNNARIHGRNGIQFPWESGPLRGEEAAPGVGRASWHEDHVSLDVAWAFTQYAHATGDELFLEREASRVLFGVSDWIVSRATRTATGYELRRTMGIAEREQPSDNDAYTTMAARVVLGEAIAWAERLRTTPNPHWREVLDGLSLRHLARSRVLRSHDGFQSNESKGATPGPLAGIFPLWHDVDDATFRATAAYYLDLAPGYIGSPMLSALYGVWAAWLGDRRRSASLFREGYADLVTGRFLQTMEQAPELEPDKPASGPFFANLGGFLMGLAYGLPGIRLGPEEPEAWPRRPVVLPAGWRSIEIERAWVRREPARIVARHGAARASIERGGRARGRRAA
jgi:trehalose/maltose hydrolase-like predicted phosphorylase